MALRMGWLLALALAAEAGDATFEVAFSEKLDAATFLNAISDDARFNGPWKDLREAWRPKIEADNEAAPAFARWLGRGIQLAYLLSVLPEDDLDGTIRRLEAPEDALAAIERGIDEPAYQRVFADLRNDLDGVRAILTFLRKEGFREARARGFQPTLDASRTALDSLLKTIDAEKFAAWLEGFTGRAVPQGRMRVYALAFCRPLSFQLAGFAVGWGGDHPDAARVIAHEFLHKLNPSAEIVGAMERLAEGDAFYHAAFDRIYGEFHEGREEEFVECAARYVIQEMGLVGRVRNLRSMKFEFFSEKTRTGGVPLAAILFDELSKTHVSPGEFDYDAFIAKTLVGLNPGTIQERYEQVIRPVAGTAGMVIREDGSVERLFEGYPAAQGGLAPGDRLLEVNGSPVTGRPREEVLDLLAGEPGASIDLLVRRAGGEERVRFTLR